jgi:flagellar hook-associated protein FlgK
VTQVNALEDQILSLNKQIVALGGQQSAQTSTLIDQREVAAESLVGLTGASVNYNTDGAMVVTFSGGTLVDGVQSSHLGIINSPTVPGMSDIGYVAVGSNVMEDVTADFSSGTLGGLYSGQSSVRQTVLALNKMASGIIQYSNEVNESTTGPNGDLNALFYGTEAADITVNPDVLANPQLALAGGTDPLNPGNLAAAQAAMTSLNMYAEVESFNSTNINAGGIELNAGVPINPNASLASQAALFSNPNPSVSGVLVINSGLNSVSITWNNSESLNDIIGLINSQSGGAIYATLQTIPNGATVNGQALNPGQYVHIYSNAPMSVYDQSGNLSSALQLVSVLNSSAPINAVPTTGVNQVNPNQPLNYVAPNPNTVDNPLALFTQPVAPPTGGTVEVGGNPADVFTWNPNDTLNTILNSMTTADPNITALFSTPPFTPVQQVSL